MGSVNTMNYGGVNTMKGRNTTVVSIRLGDDIVGILSKRAGNMPVSEYIKAKILKSCSVNNGVNTIDSVNTTDSQRGGVEWTR